MKKVFAIALVAVCLWVALRWLLPVVLPFLLGALLALAAEPAVSFAEKRLRLSRKAASGLGVSLTLVLLTGLVVFSGALLVRQLGRLTGSVPDLEAGAAALEDWLLTLAEGAPEGIRMVAQKTVLDFFDDGTALVRQMSDRLPSVVGSLVAGVGNGFLGIGTGLLAAFLISVRLPKLRQKLRLALPTQWNETYRPALRRVRQSLVGWIKAQGKLALVTWGIVSLGFFLLGIPYWPLWAMLVALVDAVPILGTGIVLIPWAAASFLQGQQLRAAGLLCCWGAAMLTRTVLEPKLMGRQLGLDPLLTLGALYVGFRFWGIPGLLLTPILASALKSTFWP
jgi:sporulation integral membrane protein YtvI